MANTTRLANDQIGSGKTGIQQVLVVFQAAIVMSESSADTLNNVTVVRNVAAAPSNAQYGLLIQMHCNWKGARNPLLDDVRSLYMRNLGLVRIPAQ